MKQSSKRSANADNSINEFSGRHFVISNVAFIYIFFLNMLVHIFYLFDEKRTAKLWILLKATDPGFL